MLSIAVCFLAGILLSQGMAIPAALLGLAAVLLLLFCFDSRSERRLAMFACLVFATGFGCLHGKHALEIGLADRLVPSLAGEVLLVSGEIVSMVERGDRYQRFEFAPLAWNSERNDLPQRLRVSLYANEPAVHPGEQWRFALKLREPRGFSNPGGFDIERWYLRRGIGGVGYVRGVPAPEYLGEAAGPAAVRAGLVEHLAGYFAAVPNAHLMRALLFGDRSGFAAADWARFRNTGTSHLVAISGLHLGLLASGSLAFCMLLGGSRMAGQQRWWRAQLLLVGLVVSAYAFLAGFGVPVQRALLMVLAVLAAQFIGRRMAWNSLFGLALLVLLLLDPMSVHDTGFWLSFSAVAVLALLLAGGIRHRQPLLEAWCIQWRLLLVLLPTGVSAFGLLAPASWIANLLAIPWLAMVILPLLFAGSVAAFLGGFLAPLAATLLALADRALALLCSLLDRLALWLPATAVPPEPANMAALACLALLVLVPRALLPRVALVLAATLLMPLATIRWADHADVRSGDWRMTVLDVGQGSALLIETASHALLYDTGPRLGERSAAELVIVPFLASRGLTLDRIMVSHGDSDHAGGIDVLRSHYPNAEVIVADSCVADRRWRWNGVDFRILHPPADMQGSDNDRSCVLAIHGHYSALLTGDIETSGERLLLAALPATDERYDVVVAPHHGSRSSSSEALVQRLSPALVIFSAGHGNYWGFPDANVRQRWERAGARSLVTGDAGAIEVSVWQGRLRACSWRQQGRRPWHYPAEVGDCLWPAIR